MSTEEEAAQAIDALAGTVFNGRTIRVQKSLPRDEAKKQAKKRDVGVTKLYVGNVAFDATKDDIMDLYSGEDKEKFCLHTFETPNAIILTILCF